MSETSEKPRRRKWWFPIAALLIPVVFLVALEFAFRLLGVGEVDPWANHHVSFQSGERYFPQWGETVAMPKPEGTTRIFAFGGSSLLAYGIDSWVSRLPVELGHRLPGGRFEVVNGGVSAFGTHRVLEVMKEAVEFDPDFFILYTGHNEFLDEIFFDPDGFIARQERFTEAVSRLRLIRVLRGVIGMDPIELPRPNVQRHFLGNSKLPLIRDPEQYRLRLEFLRENVTQMCRFAASRGIPILVMPAVPSYLYAPEYPVHGPGYADAAEEWDTQMEKGDEAWEAGDRNAAAAAFRRAQEIDESHADPVFHLALVDLAAGRIDRAREKLERAIDLDKAGVRANSDVRRIVLEAGRAEAGLPTGASVHVFDPAPVLTSYIPRDFERISAGRKDILYADHCHLSEEGHLVFSSLVAEQVAGILGE